MASAWRSESSKRAIRAALGCVLEADDADHLVQVEIDDQQAVQDVQARVDLAEAEAGSPTVDLAPVVQEGLQRGLQAQDARGARLVQHVHVDREADLQVAEAIEALHQVVGLDGAGLGLDDQADVLRRLVADVAEQGGLLQLDQGGERLHQAGLGDLVGHLGDDDAVGALARILLVPAGAHADAAPAGLVGLKQGRGRLHDHAAGGEVGAGDALHQVGGGGLGALEQDQAGVDQLHRVVGGDGGGHAHRDPAGAVGQQVGEGGREHHRLAVLPVIGGAEVHRVLVEPFQQEAGRGGELALGVAHGRGVIAVDVAEVALAVDQRIALGEVLGQAHQRLIDRLVAVGVEAADDVADHARAFLSGRAGLQPHLAHGVEQAPVHGLQPVADVGQGAVHDGGQRVGEVAARERFAQRLLDDAAALAVGRLGRGDVGGHGRCVVDPARRRSGLAVSPHVSGGRRRARRVGRRNGEHADDRAAG